MARDGVFFKGVGYLDPRTRVPTVAIVLQGVCAAVIAFTGKYDQILNYVVAIDVLFFGLTGASLLIFRARLQKETSEEERLRVPWHPITTSVFVLACWAISISTVVQFPRNAGHRRRYSRGRRADLPAVAIRRARCVSAAKSSLRRNVIMTIL